MYQSSHTYSLTYTLIYIVVHVLYIILLHCNAQHLVCPPLTVVIRKSWPFASFNKYNAHCNCSCVRQSVVTSSRSCIVYTVLVDNLIQYSFNGGPAHAGDRQWLTLPGDMFCWKQIVLSGSRLDQDSFKCDISSAEYALCLLSNNFSPTLFRMCITYMNLTKIQTFVIYVLSNC